MLKLPRRGMKLVLDDFYGDPDSLRDLALELEFTSRARNFPGSRSTRTLIPEELRELFSSERIPYNGCFQLMLKPDEARAYVHADSSASWAGLVYLSRKKEPSGGTLFFEHRLTGLSRYPQPEELPRVARELDLSEEELRLLLREDRKQLSKWRELDRVGFVYNRFVLYDAQLFHSNGKTWGTSLNTGRLTHNFFV